MEEEHNVHIGFHEPREIFEKETHCIDLTESTIEANKRFFEPAVVVLVESALAKILELHKERGE